MPSRGLVARPLLPIHTTMFSPNLPSLSMTHRAASDRDDSPTTAVEFYPGAPSLPTKHLKSVADAKTWAEPSMEMSSTTLNGDNMDDRHHAPSSRLSIRRDSSRTFSDENDRTMGFASEWDGSESLCSVSGALYFGKSSDTFVGGTNQVPPSASQPIEKSKSHLERLNPDLFVFPIFVPGDFFDEVQQRLYPIRPPLPRTVYPSRIRNEQNKLPVTRPPDPKSDPFARFRPFTVEEWWESWQSETDDSDYEQLSGEPEKPPTPQLIPKTPIRQKANVQVKLESIPTRSRKRGEDVDERMTPSRMFALAGLETERIPLLADAQPTSGCYYGTILAGAGVEVGESTQVVPGCWNGVVVLFMKWFGGH
ncbi:hypothetical protein BJ742DRAFT_801272 [Cladochytrium replicatum]|nr:hypothetical protein BJ742DRAFT_801272 [Cladochytrium replicatum]